ncbi:MAG: patatin-like phospholipase family protein [Microthrixaceae bacterium]|nr:patatin-like phospholipase family protein [Microthrixaceae bacterium]
MIQLPPRVTVVLGSGGAGGWMFHLGVLRALRAEAGFHLGDASRVIATSAGAGVAAPVLTGTSLTDTESVLMTPPSGEERRAFDEARDANRERGLERFTPVAPQLAGRVLSNPLLAGSGLLPAGTIPTAGLARADSLEDADRWPQALWVTATRLSDGEPIVFGADRHDAPLAKAVQASQAIPGAFAPVEIDGERYVDGGLVSPNHAELALADPCDLVILVSVQSRPGLRATRVQARRRLGSELATLDDAGLATVLIEVDDATNARFRGFPRSNRENGRVIQQHAARLTRDALRRWHSSS